VKIRALFLLLSITLALSPAASAAAPSLTDSVIAHSVQPGDTLSDLAAWYLGHSGLYLEIVQATNEASLEDPSFAFVEDPNLILVGWKLAIPSPTQEASEELPVEPPATLSAEAPAVDALQGKIAFSAFNLGRDVYEIQIIHADGSDRRILMDESSSEPALSPDGERIAFRGWQTHRGIMSTLLDGTDLIAVTGFHEDGQPSWSDDGSQIVFASKREDDRRWRIYVVNSNGTEERVLRRDTIAVRGRFPTWSPDGAKIAYQGCDDMGTQCGIMTMDWDGRNPFQVTDSPADSSPDWSPDGSRIAYMSDVNGNWDIYTVDPDGMNPLQLTDNPTNDGLPVWSPDGKAIAFVSDRDGTWGIYIMLPDGSAQRKIHTLEGAASPPLWSQYGGRDWRDEQISWSR
jgi:TolB protein